MIRHTQRKPEISVAVTYYVTVIVTMSTANLMTVLRWTDGSFSVVHCHEQLRQDLFVFYVKWLQSITVSLLSRFCQWKILDLWWRIHLL